MAAGGGGKVGNAEVAAIEHLAIGDATHDQRDHESRKGNSQSSVRRFFIHVVSLCGPFTSTRIILWFRSVRVLELEQLGEAFGELAAREDRIAARVAGGVQAVDVDVGAVGEKASG